MKSDGTRRLLTLLLCLLLATLSSACDDDKKTESDDTGDSVDGDIPVDDVDLDMPEVGPPAPPIVLSSGTAVLEIDLTAQTIRLGEGDRADLAVFDLSALQIGVVNAFDDAELYDPYGFKNDDLLTPPPDLREWVVLRGYGGVESDADSAEVLLIFEDGREGTLSITTDAAQRFHLTLTPGEGDGDVAYVRLRPELDATEAYYGLGEVFDSVNHRGHIRAMQIEIEALESGYNEAHVPVPLLIGTRGWGLFIASYETGVFDVAAEDEDRLDVIYTLVTDSELTFHLFAEPHPLDITQHYYDVTSYPILPARWALGPWIWRDENDDQAQVVSDVNTIRDLDLATTAYWIDRPYATAVNTFDFDATMFPTPATMIAEAHDLGFRMALWHTPYVDGGDPAAAVLYEEAETNGYFPPVTGIQLNGWSRPIDLTNPAAYAWWQGNIRQYTDMGIEGFKLDYAEDVVPGALGVRNVWSFADGRDERTMHAEYQLLYHQVYAETLPSTGGFLLARGGTWGDQANVSIIWPGDLDADFSKHGDMVTDGDENWTAVGGLPAALIGGLSLGPSGFPLYGADTGGYRHSPPDKETFARWMQVSALSPVMQVGTSTNDVPWEFRTENGFDQELLDWYRIYARLHLRLWPYVWTYLNNIAEDGRPIQRALGLAYPELGVHPDDVFLLGDDILVAPVVEAGVTSRTFTLPPGVWMDWWTDEVLMGGTEVTRDAPLGTLPMFQRVGSMIPMLRPTIDAMAPTGQPGRVDSFATSAGRLWVRVAIGEDRTAALTGDVTLYDDTRLGMDGFQSGQPRLEGLVVVPGSEFAGGIMWEIVGSTPTNVSVSDLPLSNAASTAALEMMSEGWVVDPVSGHTLIKLDAGAQLVQLSF